ncbi:MAG TPA: TlyA family RNA methyltransferase [Ignavibacteriales bacterium]|nr:TlyA family RNA methyltransferase [Ignavibacteriales bacterium]
MAEKKRIDVYLFEQGIADSREKAKALIIAGEVYVDGQRCDKPSSTLGEGQSITVRKAHDYVSRGGKKLEKAIKSFDIDLKDKVAIDVGASTGGFTDCMLQNGAKYVYAVDVGHGQLAWSLRQDSRVCVMEHTNARYLTQDMFDRDIAFASIDVSFISLKLILPSLKNVLTAPYSIAALIKPQFEAGKDKVGKKGVVRDKDVHIDVISEVLSFAQGIGLSLYGLTYSPIKGPEGNIEYLAYFKSEGESISADIDNVVQEAHLNANQIT